METREMSASNEKLENENVLNTENEVNEVIEQAASTAPVLDPPAEEVKAEAEPEPAPVVEAQPEPEPEPEPVQEPEPEPAQEAEPEAEPEPEAEEQSAVNYGEMGKDELVACLEELCKQPIDQVKDEVPAIKAAFYAIRKEEIAAEKAEFIAKGNEESAFAVKEDQLENRLKELLNEMKEKRAEFNAARDAERKENLDKKNAIIAEINKLSEDPDNINRQYSKLQQLQQDFKNVGEVPATDATVVWKNYQKAVEKFYDLLKMNKELRDYDFKKNLEIKQQLCADAEALDDENDVVTAFRKLQDLHSSWREAGPVAKELREDLWARFKNASAIINKKYQAFFEERKAAEKENADAKTALCEKIEQISTENLKTYAAWDEVTKQIIALQNDWKKLGFASRKLNNELFARFRKKCDEFFAQKAEFFKTMKEEMAANLAKKTELCEKAEALKDSTDWKNTTDALVALQKEWKTIGPVVKKHSDAVWKRFINACDSFFEQKKKQTSSTRSMEHENLKAKKELIAEINALLEANDTENGPQQVRDLMSKWGTIGHVPFKEKDKVYAAYREAVDKAFEQFDMKGTRARMAHFERAIDEMGGDDDKVSRERDRLVRIYEQKCGELKTYENNMGFFTARSQSGNTIVKEMERKVANLKEEIETLEKKIKLIDEKS